MKATLLLENHALFCKFYNSEHGFAAWIEDEDKKVLIDTGYSDNFIINAEKMGIDLRKMDCLILSHGHYDHTGGLKYLLKYFDDKGMYRKPILYLAHEDIFLPKYQFEWNENIGMDVEYEYLKKYFNIIISHEPVWITKNLVFMGMTKVSNDFERTFPQSAKKRLPTGEWVDDYCDEDSQLAYLHKNGEDITIIATCAHYGICNIMEYAKKLTDGKRIHTYLGGSHLRSDEVPESQMVETCKYLSKENIENFYICHDTDMECVIRMAKFTNVKEAGVGLVVKID